MARRERRRASARKSQAASNGASMNGESEDLGPLAHSSEAELAEVQLALGRPDLADRPSEDELEAAERATERDSGRASGPAAGALATTRSHEVESHHRPGIGARAVGFIQGSWRELQRVQWPDRRQVMQATGVVIGFVIVAGAFLGVASFAAQKLVNLILYGHG